MRNKNENNPIYIRTMQACDIYAHMHRQYTIKPKYTGMIPYSLQSLKLQSIKNFKCKKSSRNSARGREKYISNDVINVKFDIQSKDIATIIKDLQKIINKETKKLEDMGHVFTDEEIKQAYTLPCDNSMENKIEKSVSKQNKKSNEKIESKIMYINKLLSRKATFSNIKQSLQSDEHWIKRTGDELRNLFADEGFNIESIDYKTKKTISTHYVMWQRSSAKSRTGQCLFIKDSLYQTIKKWSRLDLPFDNTEAWEGDFCGLLAYEALVGSALEDVMKIDPENILLVSDVEDKFPWDCNVIRKNEETKFLDSFPVDNCEVTNSLFDGESLLQTDFFPEGHGFKLLRNHFTKTAAFNCDIQKFLRDHCPEGQDYDTWIIENEYCKLYAKDVLMIMCPTSLKLLKFSADFHMSDAEMFKYWKQKIKQDNCLWGVVKHEKKSKRGTDFAGNTVQQTSYQMLNSLPCKQRDVLELTSSEIEYIKKLKNDINVYLDFLRGTANRNNTNDAMVAVAEYNPKIIQLKFFKDLRADKISKYVKNCKKGKVKLVGDYCVLLGNPIEYLYHAIGVNVLDDDFEHLLNGNEIYTTLHAVGKEYTVFRNPHTSPSNVLVCKNKKVPKIDKYFNLTDQIVCINAVGFPVQDILSSCDYDSDTAVIFDNDKLTEVAKKCFGKYRPCINGEASNKANGKKKYTATNANMAKIDNTLSHSQNNIGECVNAGQIIMSAFWDLINSGKPENDPEVQKLLKLVDVATVLSCIAIDFAKKMYKNINLEDEIKHLNESVALKKDKKEKPQKPKFFNYLHGKYTDVEYQTTMDYIYKAFCNIKYADHLDEIALEDMLVKQPCRKVRYKQVDIITEIIEQFDTTMGHIYSRYLDKQNNDEAKKDKQLELDDAVDECLNQFENKKIKPDTMYVLLQKLNDGGDLIHFKARMLQVLYDTQKDVFLGAFKNIEQSKDVLTIKEKNNLKRQEERQKNRRKAS